MLVAGLVVAAVFVGALTRATFGFGEAVVAMPLLALLPVSLHTAASLVGLAGLTVAVLSTASRSRQVDAAALVRLSVGTVVGIPLGLALLLYVPVGLTTVALGVFLALYALYGLLPAPAPAPAPAPGQAGLGWAYPAGVLAGALGSAYNFNGVPVVVYGTLRRWGPARFRGTLQAHFVVSGVFVVAAQALGGVWTPALPRLFGASLPAIAAATWLGHRLHRRIPAERFTRFVYMLVLVLGLLLIARVATGF
ncbi:MAG TPA: sulfite exporter TauE/SafE family protein [Acidimicrobiales bacterium]|nr:sulfite exporter TauE/SafE family protein [Acidimicrobiales bacterium]